MPSSGRFQISVVVDAHEALFLAHHAPAALPGAFDFFCSVQSFTTRRIRRSPTVGGESFRPFRPALRPPPTTVSQVAAQASGSAAIPEMLARGSFASTKRQDGKPVHSRGPLGPPRQQAAARSFSRRASSEPPFRNRPPSWPVGASSRTPTRKGGRIRSACTRAAGTA